MSPILALLLALSVTLSTTPSAAGDTEHPMTGRLPQQSEIDLHFAEHLVRLHAQSKGDSVRVVLSAWEDHRGRIEPIQRFDTLWRIERGEFSVDEIDDEFFRRLWSYRFWADDRAARATDEEGGPEHEELGYTSQFDSLTQRMAREQIDAAVENTDRHLIALAYGDRFDELVRRLRDPATVDTRLRRLYDRRVEEIYDAKEKYLWLSGGYWSAGGGARPFGGHPSFGLGMREMHRRYSWGLRVFLQLGDSAEAVQFQTGQGPVRTDRFARYGFGLEGGRYLHEGRRHTVSGVLGVGGSIVHLFYGDGSALDHEELAGFLASLGLHYRYRLDRYGSHSIDVQIRYAIADHDNESTLQLSGNSVEFLVGWGWGVGSEFQRLKAYD